MCFLVFRFQFFLRSITRFLKFIEYFQVVQLFAYFFVSIRPDFLGAYFFQREFGLFGVGPEIGLLCDALFVFNFYFLAIVVKDTSSKPLHGLSDLSIDLSS